MKRISFWRRDLGLQLLALYLLFVLPVVVAALVFDAAANDRLRHDVESADLALGRAIALETDAFLQQALAAVSKFALMPEIQSGDPKQLEPIFASAMMARTDINLFYFLDAHGIMRFHYPIGPGSTISSNFSFRQYFIDARAAAKPVVSIGRISPTTGQPVATVAQRVINARGEFVGVVATNLALEHLSETLTAVAKQNRSSDPDLTISIVDAGGQIIANPDRTRLLTDGYAQLPGLRSMLSGLPSTLIGVDASHQEWLYAYVSIPSANWIVAVQRPTETAFASPRAFHTGLIFAMVVFIIGGLFFWLMLSHRVITPLEQLAGFSQSIGRRDSTVLYTAPANIADMLTRSDQMGHLTRALKRMEEAIERRFTELSTLLETSSATSSSLDADHVINVILDQVLRLMAVHACAIVTLDQDENVLRVKASRFLSQAYVDDLRIDPQDPRSTSMRAIHSGQPVQVPDTETDVAFEPFKPRARREGFRSLLAVPLNAPHIGPTALLVYRREPHVFGHDEIELIGNFANHAAIALENAALYSRTDEQLQAQKHTLESVIQSMNDGLILHDPSRRVLFVNRRFAESINSTPSDLVGQPLDQVRRQMLQINANPDQFMQALTAALDGRGPQTFEFAIERAHRLRDIRAYIFDVVDENQRRIAQGEFYQDITRFREIDRLKSSLISTVSHELRTPLASIKGYASTLLQDDVEWDTISVREFAEVISTEADRLTLLINDLLDMNRIEAGTLKLKKTEAHIADLVHQALAQVKDTGAHQIVLNLPADLPAVTVDARRIEVVLRNLIENAIKYSANQTTIHISAIQHSGRLEIRVQDEGPGILPEHRGHIFERFFRADNSYTRISGGAGLGLAICKGFVEAHGGSIWLEDSLMGADFAFTLPIDQTD